MTPRKRVSFNLDVGLFDHLSPFGGIIGDDLGEFSRSQILDRKASSFKGLLHIGACKDFRHVSTNFFSNLRRRSGRRNQAERTLRTVSRDARLLHSRHVRREGGSLRGGNRKRLELSATNV